MTGAHEIPARAPAPRPLRRGLLPLVVGDEVVLLVRVGLPQEAGHLVIAGADPIEQLLDPTRCVRGAESPLKPVSDLVRVAEPAGADFVLELLDLRGGQVARVALVVQGT